MEEEKISVDKIIGYLEGRIAAENGSDSSWAEVRCSAYRDILRYIKNGLYESKCL